MNAQALREMAKEPRLTREEERDFVLRARAGDQRAKDRLIRQALGFVTIAARAAAQRSSVPYDDLFQEGVIGLLTALQKFDLSRKLRFSTYAVWWVRAHIGRCLVEQRSVVGRASTAKGERPRDVSLDTPVLDGMVDTRPGPEELAYLQLRDEKIRDALERLTWRRWKAGREITVRLSHEDGPTLEQIGNATGYSRERVRQVEIEVRKFLRTYLAPLAA